MSVFEPSNVMTILNNSAAIGVIAGGMTLVILTAGIDLFRRIGRGALWGLDRLLG